MTATPWDAECCDHLADTHGHTYQSAAAAHYRRVALALRTGQISDGTSIEQAAAYSEAARGAVTAT